MSSSSPKKQEPLHDKASDWKVILIDETAQQLVLYNETESRLQVVEEPGPLIAVSKETDSLILPQSSHSRLFCSLCHRSWGTPAVLDSPVAEPASVPFMDRNYFRLLDISTKDQSSRIRKPRKSLPSSSSVLKMPMEDLPEPKNLSESSFNQGYYRRFFREVGRLGRGAGGSVYRCQHVLDDIQLGFYAVKMVPVGDDHSWLNRMLREVHILENLQHPHIIDYKHAWLEYHQPTPFGPPVPCLFILMQLAGSGNLEDFVTHSVHNDGHLEQVARLFGQLCRGLAHLHRCGIIHRDLKPSNILLNQDASGTLTALITDFGEARDNLGAGGNRTGATGTIEFVAPELLKTDRIAGNYLFRHSKATDMWSLGLILYYMISGQLPYRDIDDIDVLKTEMTSLRKVVLPKEAANLPKTYQDLLGSLLQVDPELRPTIEQVLIMLAAAPNGAEPARPRLGKALQLTAPASSPDSAKMPTTTPAPQMSPNTAASVVGEDNSRITAVLFILFISTLPTYPALPNFTRSAVALLWTVLVLKAKRLRTVLVLTFLYALIVLSFLFA